MDDVGYCYNNIFFLLVVEDLFKSREPVPEMKAIYFMSPTAKVYKMDIYIKHFNKETMQYIQIISMRNYSGIFYCLLVCRFLYCWLQDQPQI